ncbi:MAG TPA: hypothetical protein VH741_07180 [Candidatus Limnocylindrales bacterium]
MTDTYTAPDLAAADDAAPDAPASPGDVRAERVEISQGGANNVNATTVTITQGGAARVSAEHLSISQGGVGAARAGSLSISQGGAFGILADQATLEEGATAFLVIARETKGPGRALVDWRAAAAFGAAFALVLALLRRGR